MNYEKIYNNLINNAKIRIIDENKYYEKHHIIPKSLDGSDKQENIIQLTLREHYFAHELLCFIYPNSKELSNALWIMTVTTLGTFKKYNENKLLICNNKTYKSKRIYNYINKENKTLHISSYQYSFAREQYIKNSTGRILSEKQKINISEKTKQGMNNPETIKKCSINKGSHYYHSLDNKYEYKWFPGDFDIDLTKFAWGRKPMSNKAKENISKSQNINRTLYYNEDIDMKYWCLNDYIKCMSYGWQTHKKPNTDKVSLNIIKKTLRITKDKIRFTNNKQYNKLLNVCYIECKYFTKYRRLKLSPSVLDLCFEKLKNERYTNENICEELSELILNNLDKIKELNKIYLK